MYYKTFMRLIVSKWVEKVECHMCMCWIQREEIWHAKIAFSETHPRVRKLVKNLKGHVTRKEQRQKSTTVANLFLLNFKLSTFLVFWECGKMESRKKKKKKRKILTVTYVPFFFILLLSILPYNQHEHFQT